MITEELKQLITEIENRTVNVYKLKQAIQANPELIPAINSNDSDIGFPVIASLCLQGDTTILAILLAAGADPNHTCDTVFEDKKLDYHYAGFTPLQFVLAQVFWVDNVNGYVEILTTLFKFGAVATPFPETINLSQNADYHKIAGKSPIEFIKINIDDLNKQIDKDENDGLIEKGETYHTKMAALYGLKKQLGRISCILAFTLKIQQVPDIDFKALLGFVTENQMIDNPQELLPIIKELIPKNQLTPNLLQGMWDYAFTEMSFDDCGQHYQFFVSHLAEEQLVTFVNGLEKNEQIQLKLYDLIRWLLTQKFYAHAFNLIQSGIGISEKIAVDKKFIFQLVKDAKQNLLAADHLDAIATCILNHERDYLNCGYNSKKFFFMDVIKLSALHKEQNWWQLIVKAMIAEAMSDADNTITPTALFEDLFWWDKDMIILNQYRDDLIKLCQDKEFEIKAFELNLENLFARIHISLLLAMLDKCDLGKFLSANFLKAQILKQDNNILGGLQVLMHNKHVDFGNQLQFSFDELMLLSNWAYEFIFFNKMFIINGKDWFGELLSIYLLEGKYQEVLLLIKNNYPYKAINEDEIKKNEYDTKKLLKQCLFDAENDIAIEIAAILILKAQSSQIILMSRAFYNVELGLMDTQILSVLAEKIYQTLINYQENQHLFNRRYVYLDSSRTWLLSNDGKGTFAPLVKDEKQSRALLVKMNKKIALIEKFPYFNLDELEQSAEKLDILKKNSSDLSYVYLTQDPTKALQTLYNKQTLNNKNYFDCDRHRKFFSLLLQKGANIHVKYKKNDNGYSWDTVFEKIIADKNYELMKCIMLCDPLPLDLPQMIQLLCKLVLQGQLKNFQQEITTMLQSWEQAQVLQEFVSFIIQIDQKITYQLSPIVDFLTDNDLEKYIEVLWHIDNNSNKKLSSSEQKALIAFHQNIKPFDKFCKALLDYAGKQTDGYLSFLHAASRENSYLNQIVLADKLIKTQKSKYDLEQEIKTRLQFLEQNDEDSNINVLSISKEQQQLNEQFEELFELMQASSLDDPQRYENIHNKIEALAVYQINQTNMEGETLLYIAVARAFPLNIIKQLIDKQASLSLADQDGNTPLQIATFNQDVDRMHLILMSATKDDILHQNHDEKDALMIAIDSLYWEVVDEILQSAYYKDIYTAPVFYAIDNKQQDFLEYLTNNQKIDFYAKYKNSNLIPLIYAHKNNKQLGQVFAELMVHDLIAKPATIITEDSPATVCKTHTIKQPLYKVLNRLADEPQSLELLNKACDCDEHGEPKNALAQLFKKDGVLSYDYLYYVRKLRDDMSARLEVQNQIAEVAIVTI